MSEYLTPCQRPDADPEDWFIEKDGRQYADDDLLTEIRIQEIMLEHDGESISLVEEAIDEAEAEALKAALTRRRHAKDACYTCYFRTQCLDIALTERPNHGTYGGYYPEELRQIARLKDEREHRRRQAALAAKSRDADVAAGE